MDVVSVGPVVRLRCWLVVAPVDVFAPELRLIRTPILLRSVTP